MKEFENYIHIDTDRSCNPLLGKSGKGVHSLDKNFSFSSGLPDLTQLYTAEVVAINKALRTALENKLNRSIQERKNRSKKQQYRYSVSLGTGICKCERKSSCRRIS